MDVHSHWGLRTLVILLSLAGLLDALYFTFAYYGRIKKARWVPEILCAREGSSCVTVVQTPYARVFGVPNSVLGLFYYVLLMAWVMGGQRLEELAPWMGWTLVAISGVTVALGVYLIDALRRRLHVDCPLCYTAHAINAALLVLLILLERQ
jgi:uncharacterized membrane protein